jgi:hypothetical protein
MRSRGLVAEAMNGKGRISVVSTVELSEEANEFLWFSFSSSDGTSRSSLRRLQQRNGMNFLEFAMTKTTAAIPTNERMNIRAIARACTGLGAD